MLHKYLVMFLLLAAAAALAQPGPYVLVATGKEVHVQALRAGDWFCEGGQRATQGPPCSPGTKRIFAWNISNALEYQEVTGSAAALLRGRNVTVVHANLDENYYGHLWGTFEWTVPEMDGRWEGTFAATADQMRKIVINKAVGYGYGGKLEGLKLEFTAVNPGGLPHSIFIARVSSK